MTPEFYVMESTVLGPEITIIHYKYAACGHCGTKAVARVGGIGVRFRHRRQLVDISMPAGAILARPAVMDHLCEAQMTGWRPGCVQVDSGSVANVSDPAYYELVLIGRTIQYASRAGLKVVRECDSCGARGYGRPQDGLTIPVECWDGSDVFEIPELAGIYVVTGAFRRTVEAHRHSGVAFTPTAEWKDPLGWTMRRTTPR